MNIVRDLRFFCDFGVFGVSVRAGSTDLGTISGFSCATETGWNSGLADPNFSVS